MGELLGRAEATGRADRHANEGKASNASLSFPLFFSALCRFLFAVVVGMAKAGYIDSKNKPTPEAMQSTRSRCLPVLQLLFSSDPVRELVPTGVKAPEPRPSRRRHHQPGQRPADRPPTTQHPVSLVNAPSSPADVSKGLPGKECSNWKNVINHWAQKTWPRMKQSDVLRYSSTADEQASNTWQVTLELLQNNISVTSGWFKRKVDAEQDAARLAWVRLNAPSSTPQHMPPWLYFWDQPGAAAAPPAQLEVQQHLQQKNWKKLLNNWMQASIPQGKVCDAVQYHSCSAGEQCWQATLKLPRQNLEVRGGVFSRKVAAEQDAARLACLGLKIPEL